jgi:8-oxo-dGTP pyrophosphatase MutT (NUDIX family)
MPLPPPAQIQTALSKAPANPDWDPAMAQSAVAMAIDWNGTVHGERGPAVLLMQRAEHPKDPWSGQVSLPGGRAEPVDRDLLATATREAREELNINLEVSARHLGQLPPRQAMARGGYVDLWITPQIFEVRETMAPEPSDEARDFFWLPLGPVRRGELDHKFPYRRPGSSSDLILPGLEFEKRVIWGLTYRMLLSLFEHTTES